MRCLVVLPPVFLALVVMGLGMACAEPPKGARTAEVKPPPDAADSVRTLRRQPSSEVVVDERFFEPFMLAKGTPKALKKAYKDWIEGNNSKAKSGFEAFLAASPKHEMAPKAAMLLAVLEARAGKHTEAADRFEKVARDYPILSDHALWRGARAAFAATRYKQTVRLCKGIEMSSPFGARSRHLRAQALMRQGQHKDGIMVLESLLKDYPGASFSADVRLELAAAYEKQGRVQDAARLYHRVRTRHPGTDREKQAEKGITRVRKKLSRKDAGILLTPSHRDKVRRAEALNARHRSDKVVEEMRGLIESKTGPKAGSDVWCDGAYLMGVALRKLRKHTDASAAFEKFIQSCKKRSEDETVKALYQAGRSYWTVDKDLDALRCFKRIWEEFPSHTYADDAVLYGSRIERGRGRTKAADTLLDFQLKTFPRGDMLGSAHWQLFSQLYKGGKLEKAVRYVDGVGKATGEVDIYTRGRLHYFRARALEDLGRKKDAMLGFADVINHAPMSYYALLSFGRLRAMDAQAAERLLAEIETSGGKRNTWTIEPPAIARDKNFERGVELLRIGLFSDAQAEFDRLRKRYPGHEQVLWTLTLLFDRAGAYHLSHNIPRRKIGSFGTAWPVGRSLDMFLLAYPRPFHDKVSSWAKKRSLPEALVYAIMREESGFNPRIESWANAYGLMQLILPTAKDMANADGMRKANRLSGRDLFRPETNIRLGTRFLSTLHQSYDKHPAVTIAGYNGGFGNVDKWLKARGKQPLDLWVEDIPFGQTRHYTKRVLTSYWIYQWLYGTTEGETVGAAERLVDLSWGLPGPSN